MLVTFVLAFKVLLVFGESNLLLQNKELRENGGCTAPWVSIEGMAGCFLFRQDRMNWNKARSHCQRNEGDLVILDTRRKRRNIIKYMENHGLKNGHPRHIGANTRTRRPWSMRPWRWVNGERVTNGWRSYNDNEPDNDQGRDACMYLYTKSYPSGRYDLLSDGKCTTKRYFICEKVEPKACRKAKSCTKLDAKCIAKTAPCKSGITFTGKCKGKKCVCCANFDGNQAEMWWNLGQMELEAALNVRRNTNIAKNIILFLGDGMGITASTAGRIYKGQQQQPKMNGEEGYLAWEQFPNMGLTKTYNVDSQVPDSAGTATAYLCGIKGNKGTLGVGPEVTREDCPASLMPEYRSSSILRWAQDAKKHTGIVTTTRVTHATPAASYAHSADRGWEDDSELGTSGQKCKDIADQLVNGKTGKNIKVILGGGRKKFRSDRQDGRDLISEWQKDKEDRGSYVTNATDLASVNVRTTDYLLGLFTESHMSYENERLESQEDEPSLTDMTLKAIEMLSKNKDGFFLLVEGGRIDHGLHNNDPKKALGDLLAFDDAISAALKELNMEETLVIVTADHSHVMTLNGYPERGNDILGVAGVDNNGFEFNTLLFTNGPNETVAFKPLDIETHGGEDVAVYAAGPMAHLFHTLHEQNYVAHVMAYAACIGPNQLPKCKTSRSRSNNVDKQITDQQHSTATTNAKQSRLPVISEQLQQHLDEQRNQLISQLGSQVVPRMARYNDTDDHVH